MFRPKEVLVGYSSSCHTPPSGAVASVESARPPPSPALECHDVGCDEYGSMESLRAVDNGAIRGPGLVNAVEHASSIATYAAHVAPGRGHPAPLPSE